MSSLDEMVDTDNDIKNETNSNAKAADHVCTKDDSSEKSGIAETNADTKPIVDQAKEEKELILRDNADSSHKAGDHMSLEAILELVDEVENQVERFRENVMSLVAEKSSLQSTLHTITQMISQSSDDMISMSATNSTKKSCIQTAQGKSYIGVMISGFLLRFP